MAREARHTATWGFDAPVVGTAGSNPPGNGPARPLTDSSCEVAFETAVTADGASIDDLAISVTPGSGGPTVSWDVRKSLDFRVSLGLDGQDRFPWMTATASPSWCEEPTWDSPESAGVSVWREPTAMIFPILSSSIRGPIGAVALVLGVAEWFVRRRRVSPS